MKQRFTFKCWNCKLDYTLFKEITDQQLLIVACPYCNEEAIVKLDTIPRKNITVMRGDSPAEQAVTYEYQFPKVIPTEKPE